MSKNIFVTQHAYDPTCGYLFEAFWSVQNCNIKINHMKNVYNTVNAFCEWERERAKNSLSQVVEKNCLIYGAYKKKLIKQKNSTLFGRSLWSREKHFSIHYHRRIIHEIENDPKNMPLNEAFWFRPHSTDLHPQLKYFNSPQKKMMMMPKPWRVGASGSFHHIQLEPFFFFLGSASLLGAVAYAKECYV